MHESVTFEQLASPNVLLWLANHGTKTPPGMWLEAARLEAAKRGASPDEITRLMAVLAVAEFDTSIMLWKEKYRLGVARPETKFKQWFGVDAYQVHDTPMHPSYPAGHAGFSGSGAKVFESLVGGPITFSTPPLLATPADIAAAMPDQPMPMNTEEDYYWAEREFEPKTDVITFESASAAADAAAQSRVDALYHFPSDVAAGLTVGRCVGGAVLKVVDDLVSGRILN